MCRCLRLNSGTSELRAAEGALDPRGRHRGHGTLLHTVMVGQRPWTGRTAQRDREGQRAEYKGKRGLGALGCLGLSPASAV